MPGQIDDRRRRTLSREGMQDGEAEVGSIDRFWHDRSKPDEQDRSILVSGMPLAESS